MYFSSFLLNYHRFPVQLDFAKCARRLKPHRKLRFSSPLLHSVLLLSWLVPGGSTQVLASSPFTQAIALTAASGANETIPLEATVQVSPPQINIKTYVAGTFTINRKDPSVKTWTQVGTGVALAASGVWTDSNVSVGSLYEYQFINTAGAVFNVFHYPIGYILTGINVDQTQPKGRMAVVVASDLPANLPVEYAQYKADLVADGWVVNELQVPRAPNFTALGNGAITKFAVANGGTTTEVSGAIVHLTNASGKIALGTLSVSAGVITAVATPNYSEQGSGFAVGDVLTINDLNGKTSSAYTITVSAVDNSETGRPVTIAGGGSGYTDNDTVGIKGSSSGATAIGSLIAPTGTIAAISVVLPNTFTVGETLTLTPSLGGSGASATVGASLDNHLLIRSAIQTIYNTYPGRLKNIVMVGRVPICRSGINDGFGADGHGNCAPYGTDAFYAEMLGVVGVDWTDTLDNTTVANLGYNLPGDKQFDQQTIFQVTSAGGGNGGVELGFGRIDLSVNISTEVEAERTYFNKLHRYKTADPSFLPGRAVCDRVGYPNERETDLQSMPGVVGMNNITFITNADLPTAVPGGQDPDQLYSVQHGPYLFYFKGDSTPMAGVGGKAVFWTGMQSHWGYWYQYNDMQLRLGEDNFTLDFTWNIWGLRYIYHRMGMGLDAGDMMMQSINNQGFSNNGLALGAGPYIYTFNNTNNGDYHGSLYMNQMGDPALRLFMFAPPARLSVVTTSGNPVLSWVASPDGTVSGYHVYRAVNANAPFTRLTSTPLTGTTYTDSSVSSGSYVYMVRAVRLETTGGGTFYNASLGVTQSVNFNSTPTSVTISTTSIPGVYWNTPTSLSLAAQGGIPQYNWALTSGTLPAGLTLSNSGVISGSATAIGSCAFTVQATDQINQSASHAFTLNVSSNSQTRIYPIATTYTNSAATTTSYGTSESDLISVSNETFQRYDLSGVTFNNGPVKATLYLYVTSNTLSNAGVVQANLLTDAADGWLDNGIAKFFLSAAASPTSGWTRIHCVGHGWSTGTQVTIGGLTGLSAATPYAINSIDADNFDIHVTYGGWAYDPAYAYATTLSMTYAIRPTAYDLNVPTLAATGYDAPGTLLQMDVTSYVKEVVTNFPGKQMGIRLFSTASQAIAVGSLHAFGGAIPYLVIETTNAPMIAINSPTVNPAVVIVGSSLLINTTVTPLPSRAGSLNLQWSKVSGPGTVTFTNPTNASTGASFSVAGDYTLQLTADDGVAQSTKNLTVQVRSAPVAGPIDSMVLHLPFDESSGTIAHDTSGVTPANNGTLTAYLTNPLPVWTTSGKVGGALTFNGSGQQVVVSDSITNPNPLDGMQQLTISTWIYANAFPSGVFSLVCKGASFYGNYSLNFRGGTTSSAIRYYIGGNWQDSASALLLNAWYHMVVVFDGTQTTNNLRFYLNGNLDKVSTINLTSVPRSAATNLYIGAPYLGTTGFNGLMDDVRIYNRVLSVSEIQDLYSVTPSNVGPAISTATTLSGTVNQPLSLTATAMVYGKSSVLTSNWAQINGPSSLTIASPFSLSTTTTAGTPGVYGFLLSACDGAITTFANISATITGQNFSSWAAQQGLTGINALPTAVVAADGLSNLLKYACGLTPSIPYNPGAPGLPSVQLLSDRLSLTFTGVASDVTYQVQATSDLTGAWTTIQTFPVGTTPGTVTVQDTQPVSATSKRFMRLLISL